MYKKRLFRKTIMLFKPLKVLEEKAPEYGGSILPLAIGTARRMFIWFEIF